MKVLAVFWHRPEKTSAILPYSGVDYRFWHVTKKNRILWRLFPPLAYMDMFSMIYSYQPDIVYTSGGIDAHRLGIVTKLMKKRFVVRIGGDIYAEYKELKDKRCRHEINNIVMADHVIKVANHIQVPQASSVVPVPITPKFNSNGYKGDYILTIINLNFKAKVDAMIDYLPAVFKVLKSCNKFRYKIVAPGRYRGELVRYLQNHDTDGQVDIYDYQSDLQWYYENAGVFVYFSYLDGCPNVILEAWSAKLPVIVNLHDWNRELITDGYNGISDNSLPYIALKIDHCLRDKKLAKQLGNAGYAELSKYTPQIAGQKLGEAFDRVAKINM